MAGTNLIGVHMAALKAANYVLVLKDFISKRPRTRIGLTSARKAAAFESYMAYLRTLLDS